jgi:choline dehydrogenase-like flavoprotein
MRRHPGPFESDVLGVPSGFTRVHAVDASILPDIPPTTITLTIMANAHRIATRAVRQEG